MSIFLNIILGLICAYYAEKIARELWRAARQSHRVASAILRWEKGIRKPTWRQWWYSFKAELMFGYYDELVIGGYVLNRDPNIPAKAFR